jgi:hypothetical protein
MTNISIKNQVNNQNNQKNHQDNKIFYSSLRDYYPSLKKPFDYSIKHTFIALNLSQLDV